MKLKIIYKKYKDGRFKPVFIKQYNRDNFMLEIEIVKNGKSGYIILTEDKIYIDIPKGLIDWDISEGILKEYFVNRL